MKIPVKQCSFFEFTDLIGPVMSQYEADCVSNELNDSEISFGNNNRTMVSIERFRELIRSADGIEPDEANAIVDKLNEIAKPTDYIDVEN